MKRAKGSGCQLWPENFSKELFAVVNLPGLHILEETFIPCVVSKLCETREFVRRHTRMEQLIGGNKGLSASVKNNRNKLDKVTRLPLIMFKK